MDQLVPSGCVAGPLGAAERGEANNRSWRTHTATPRLWAEGWFQGKTGLWKTGEGRAGEQAAGKGKTLTHLLCAAHAARLNQTVQLP